MEENTSLIACKNVIKQCIQNLCIEELAFFGFISKAIGYAYFILQSYTQLKTMPNWIFLAQILNVQSNQMFFQNIATCIQITLV